MFVNKGVSVVARRYWDSESPVNGNYVDNNQVLEKDMKVILFDKEKYAISKPTKLYYNAFIQRNKKFRKDLTPKLLKRGLNEFKIVMESDDKNCKVPEVTINYKVKKVDYYTNTIMA